MYQAQEREYVKRTQKDYTHSFKMGIVRQIERGELSVTGAQRQHGIQGRSTVINWLRKYGNFDWENQTPSNMPKSPEQKIMELEAKVKLLEKQKALLEQQAHVSDSKAIITAKNTRNSTTATNPSISSTGHELKCCTSVKTINNIKTGFR
jgi:transposase-like protein